MSYNVFSDATLEHITVALQEYQCFHQAVLHDRNVIKPHCNAEKFDNNSNGQGPGQRATLEVKAEDCRCVAEDTSRPRIKSMDNNTARWSPHNVSQYQWLTPVSTSDDPPMINPFTADSVKALHFAILV